MTIVCVIGSSVAAGQGAHRDRGWAALLADSLKPNVTLINKAQGGTTVQHTIDRFRSVVHETKPQFVVVSLSLANEGLGLWGAVGGNAGVCKRFEDGISHLVHLIKDIGAIPIVVSVGRSSPTIALQIIATAA